MSHRGSRFQPAAAGRGWRWLLAALALGWLCLALPAVAANVLILEQEDFSRPYFGRLTRAVWSEMNRSRPQDLALYSETLGLWRFHDPEYSAALMRWLISKYAHVKLDLIISEGPAALHFARRFRDQIGSNATVLFCAVDKTVYDAESPLPSNVTGVWNRSSETRNVELARIIRPALKDVVVTGVPPDGFRLSLLPLINTIIPGASTTDLSGLPLEDMADRLARLPANAVIYFAGTRAIRDKQGNDVVPVDALKVLHRRANAPIIVPSDLFIDAGAIGGYVSTPESTAKAVTAMAQRLMSGEPPASVPPHPEDGVPMFDARELRRWGVEQTRLPAGSIILHNEPTVLQAYFWQINLVLAVLLAESMLILSLVLERRRRRAAERQMAASVTELGRLSRAAALEGLSGSIAHELNQPLGAILSNAEAAELLLQAEQPKLGLLREILTEIRKENTRASDIIRAMRALFQKRDFAVKQFDVNEMVRNVSVLAMWETGRSNYAVIHELAPDLPPVLGDPQQLQQVIFKLVSNAREAMAAQRLRSGSILISTRPGDDGSHTVELSVRDTGPGIPEQDISRIFKPHFTTKPNGMGLGLWIAYAIIEAHGGRLRATNHPGGGACFWFSLRTEEDA